MECPLKLLREVEMKGLSWIGTSSHGSEVGRGSIALAAWRADEGGRIILALDAPGARAVARIGIEPF